MNFDFQRTLRLFNDAPNPHIIKIFFYILIHQPDEGSRGFKINKLQLQFDLKLSRTNFFTYMHCLKDIINNFYRDERIDEWNRRCEAKKAN